MNTGIVLILVYVVATAFRDVFFGGVFQNHRFFDVMLITALLTIALFLVPIALGRPGRIRALARTWREAVLANLGSAAAWLSYFYALKQLEPSIVNTIHTGAGPVTLVALSALGLHISRPAAVRPVELLCHLGTLLSLIAMSAVVLFDLSGLGGRDLFQKSLGLALAFASGVFIALTSDVTKRMIDRGVTPEEVLGVRFVATAAVSGLIAAMGVEPGAPLADPSSIAAIAAAALVLIVVPVYVLQLGLARISAVSTWVILALGPCLVFAAQFLDGRIAYSPYTLACIAAYSAFVVLGNLVRRFETAPGATAATRGTRVEE